MLYQAPSASGDQVKSLEDSWIDKILESLNMDTAFDIYQYADFLIWDRLKINVIKFLAINVVSLFERTFKSQIDQMPQHLWHDIENFIKSESVNKYCWQDSSELDSLPASIEESSIGQIGFLPAFEIGSQIAGASTVKVLKQKWSSLLIFISSSIVIFSNNLFAKFLNSWNS